MAFVNSLVVDFAHFSRSNNLFVPGEKLLIAVSGGVDSMVLLDLCVELKSNWSLEIAIVHVNHQLRGDESTGDEEFVRSIATQYGLPFYSRRIDTIGLKHSLKVSKQVAARDARYQYFEEIRQQIHADHVATGHQADDDAETVLFNALRGGGVRGLAGIPLTRSSGRIIRPLLFARRKDIFEYARQQGIRFRNDSSNQSSVYSRNYLRHSVVPLLTAELGTDVSSSLNRVSNAMKELGRLLDKLVDDRSETLVRYRETECDISLPRFEFEPLFLQEEIVLRVLRTMDVEPSAVKIAKILRLCSKQPGHSLNLSRRIVARRTHDSLIFCKEVKPVDFSMDVSVGHTYSFEGFVFSLGQPEPVPASYGTDGFTEYIDGDKIRQPLAIRTWKHGDWFVPLGMKGKKKLSDFFNDIRISTFEKSAVPILASNDSIVWVCGKRLDDRYRITPSTRRAIKLTYAPTTTMGH